MDGPAADDLDLLWEAYAATTIWVRASHRWLAFVPQHDGRTEAARWPFRSAAAVAIVTAWNPGSRRRGAVENDAAQRRLVTELEAVGAELLPAAGVAPDGDWAEPSVAVIGLPVALLHEVARRYGQRAIYVLTPRNLRIEGCLDDRIRVLGWRIREEERSRRLSDARGS